MGAGSYTFWHTFSPHQSDIYAHSVRIWVWFLIPLFWERVYLLKSLLSRIWHVKETLGRSICWVYGIAIYRWSPISASGVPFYKGTCLWGKYILSISYETDPSDIIITKHWNKMPCVSDSWQCFRWEKPRPNSWRSCFIMEPLNTEGEGRFCLFK